MADEKKTDKKEKPSSKKAGLGCLVLVVVIAVLIGVFSGGDPAPVDASAPHDKQAKQAEKIYESAYYMARTALNQKAGGKLPEGLEYGLQEDCVISWMSFTGPNNFRVKMALKDKSTGRMEYVFVDLLYHGDGKWTVVGFEET